MTDHTIMGLFKGLYAPSTTENRGTLARALSMAPGELLEEVPGDTRH